MTSPARDLALLPPIVGGRYEPLAKIASGGMATVYLARARTGAGFDKLVALKCVHPHMAEDAAFVEMFLDEARIASRREGRVDRRGARRRIDRHGSNERGADGLRGEAHAARRDGADRASAEAYGDVGGDRARGPFAGRRRGRGARAPGERR